jgi:predicted nucleotidyltransferase component of viral defense system
MTNTLAFEIRKKLLKIAQEKGRPSQEILQYYAMERFLFRLSQSEYQQRFVLKGGLLLHARELTAFRATQDIDLQSHPNGKKN